MKIFAVSCEKLQQKKEKNGKRLFRNSTFDDALRLKLIIHKKEYIMKHMMCNDMSPQIMLK